MRETNDPIDVDTLLLRIAEVEADFFARAGYHWNEGGYDVEDCHIALPRLEFDQVDVDRFPRQSWIDSEIMVPDVTRRRKRQVHDRRESWS